MHFERGIQDIPLAGFRREGDDLLAQAHGTGAIRMGFNLRLRQFAALPRQVYNEPTTRSQSLYRTHRPGGGKRRKQMEFAGMALEEHLRNTGSGSKIAVNLEGWMQVKEVGGRPLRGQQVAEEFV